MRTSVVTSLALAAAATLTAAGPAAADNVEVRLATLAPDGSSWMKILGKPLRDQHAHRLATHAATFNSDLSRTGLP